MDNDVHIHALMSIAVSLTGLFDDPAGCREIGKILSQYCGRSLKEIGQIDLAHLL
jgi:hypothetical protein